MTIKLFNYQKWSQQPEGGGTVTLPGDETKARTIRLEINVPEPTYVSLRVWDVVPAADDPEAADKVAAGRSIFLWAGEGYEIVEVGGVRGTVAVDFETDGIVTYYTADASNWAAPDEGKPSFTVALERKARNPALEYMMWVEKRNSEKRFEQQQRDLAAMIENMGVRADKDTGEVHEKRDGSDNGNPRKPAGKAKAPAPKPDEKSDDGGAVDGLQAPSAGAGD